MDTVLSRIQLVQFRRRYAGKSLFVQSCDFEGGVVRVGVKDQVASSLTRLVHEISRLRMTLLEQDHEQQSDANHGTHR